MCRSIKPLRLPERLATEDEIREAALEYVRKVSGTRKPSRASQEAFDAAVEEVAGATRRMLERLGPRPVRVPVRPSKPLETGESRS